MMLARLAQAHRPWCWFQALTRAQRPWRRRVLALQEKQSSPPPDEVAEGVAARRRTG